MITETEGWLTLAQSDLVAAGVLLHGGRYLQVSFFCQQSIEKTLKAIYVEVHSRPPPKSHDLVRLAMAVGLDQDAGWQSHASFLARLTDLCERSRYLAAEWKTTLAALDHEGTAREILEKTTEVTTWLRARLS